MKEKCRVFFFIWPLVYWATYTKHCFWLNNVLMTCCEIHSKLCKWRIRDGTDQLFLHCWYMKLTLRTTLGSNHGHLSIYIFQYMLYALSPFRPPHRDTVCAAGELSLVLKLKTLYKMKQKCHKYILVYVYSYWIQLGWHHDDLQPPLKHKFLPVNPPSGAEQCRREALVNVFLTAEEQTQRRTQTRAILLKHTRANNNGGSPRQHASAPRSQSERGALQLIKPSAAEPFRSLSPLSCESLTRAASSWSAPNREDGGPGKTYMFLFRI